MQDRRRFLKYRDQSLNAMEKYVLDLDRSLRYPGREIAKDAQVVLPEYLDRYN
jgi:hypothetical protein